VSFALKLALAPLLVVQAVTTRRRAPVLPEAAGERQGRLGQGEQPLRLLIAGDSSAAGVGVLQQEQALSGYLTRELHRVAARPVHWTLRARSGLTTRQVHALLRSEFLPQVDVAVVVTGVNDVIDQVPVRRAVAHREALADWLLGEHGVAHVVFAPLPPVHRFVLLPQPLRRVMGDDARRHDAALARWAATRGDVSHVVIEFDLTPDALASDGFHPGEPVYRVCGEALAAHVAALTSRDTRSCVPGASASSSASHRVPPA
jgi:lysophospholipase L1-like esterase